MILNHRSTLRYAIPIVLDRLEEHCDAYGIQTEVGVRALLASLDPLDPLAAIKTRAAPAADGNDGGDNGPAKTTKKISEEMFKQMTPYERVQAANESPGDPRNATPPQRLMVQTDPVTKDMTPRQTLTFANAESEKKRQEKIKREAEARKALCNKGDQTNKPK